jgi:hypothetical protein
MQSLRIFGAAEAFGYEFQISEEFEIRFGNN